MCSEPRIIFACDHEKPQSSSSTVIPCKWAKVAKRLCPEEMIRADPYTSTENMYLCMDCLTQPANSTEEGKVKEYDVKGKLKDLKRKMAPKK